MDDHPHYRQKPTSCPICNLSKGYVNKTTCIAGGIIYKCIECSGYFLFPPKYVQYDDSSWTSLREKQWENDILIADKIVPKILQYTASYLGRPIHSVFEIGCGSGFMGQAFIAHGCDYTGIDVDATSISYAKDKGINAHCVALEELCKAPHLLADQYDLIISSNVFEHLNSPKEAFSNLKLINNGIIVIIVPNAEGLSAILKANKLFSKLIQFIMHNNRDIAYSIDGYWHNISYTKETLEYLCAKADINIIKNEPIGINDPVFGFVQPNMTLLYRMYSWIASLLKKDSEIILIAA